LFQAPAFTFRLFKPLLSNIKILQLVQLFFKSLTDLKGFGSAGEPGQFIKPFFYVLS